MIDESAEFCTNCGTKLLFPEDEMIEEDIPGEKALEVDVKEKTSKTAKKRKPRKKKTAPKKKKEKEIKAADTGQAEEVEIIDDEKEISEKTEISEPDDKVDAGDADLEGEPTAEEEGKEPEELDEEEPAAEELIDVNDDILSEEDKSEEEEEAKEEEEAEAEESKLQAEEEDMIDEPDETSSPDEEWDVDEHIREVKTEELSNFGEEELPGEPPDEPEEELPEGTADEIIEEPPDEGEGEVIDEDEDDEMLFPEEIIKEPGTGDEEIDFKTEDLETMVDPAEKEKEDIDNFLDSLKKERQEIKEKAAEEGEGEALPPRAAEIEESDSLESPYDEEEVPDEMPQEDKDLFEAGDIPTEETPSEIDTESVLPEALEQPSFEFSGYPAKDKKKERRKLKPKPPQIKIPAMLKARVFDGLLIAAFWFIAVWAASFLTSVSVFQLVSDSVLPTVAFFVILLAIYFLFFLVFLGETLGNLIFYKKD